MQDNGLEPKVVDFNTLKLISHEIMGKLQSSEFRDKFEYKDYHGFMKARLPDEMLASILSLRSLNADDAQIEIGHVSRDLADQVHHHKDATAYVIALGPRHGFPAPRDAYIYLNNGWREIREGEKIKIASGMAHGFTVKEGGELFFLTIQSPAIVRPHGKDDYELHERIPLKGNIKPRSRRIESPDGNRLVS